MLEPALDDPVIRHLLQWANDRDSVRALLLTSSRATPNAPVDIFSDYDVILAVTDIYPFFEDRAWLQDFGPMLVVYRDPLKRYCDLERFAYITQYENGQKIDFTFWSVEILKRVVADPILPTDLDVGYAVLLDKDGLTAGLKPPTFQAYIPTPPSQVAYQTVIEEFFHEATYVVKHLWRDDLMAAKYSLDNVMKFDSLRQMLEWRMEIDHNWSVKPGAFGRGLKTRLTPEIWSELESTYVGPRLEENWDALFSSIVFFRKIACQVADQLGYEYPHDLDQRMVAYLHRVRRLDKNAETFA